MIEVYKTNIKSIEEARTIKYFFDVFFPRLEINFDLSDVDHILRVKSDRGPVNSNMIIKQVQNLGFSIRVLTW